MKPNTGTLDRLLRTILAGALLITAIVLGAGTVAGIVLLALAAIAIATAAVGFCPLYKLLHIDTRHPRRGPGSASPSHL